MDPIVLHFARTRPANIADALVEYPPVEAAEFLTQLPPEVAASVISKLPSARMREALKVLAPAFVARLLLGPRHATTVAILSHLPASHYAAILRAADNTTDRQKLEKLFNFPSRQLAALASPEFIRVSEDTTCEALKAELESLTTITDRPIFVVDDDDNYLGMVPLRAILPSGNAGRAVSEFIETTDTLSGYMSIAAALGSHQWRHFRALPVTDAHGFILGAVTLEQLEHAVNQSELKTFGMEEIIDQVATGYLDLCADLLDVATKREE